MSPERVSVGEEGEGHYMSMDRKQKGAGTNSGESGAKNLRLRVSEAERRVREGV